MKITEKHWEKNGGIKKMKIADKYWEKKMAGFFSKVVKILKKKEKNHNDGKIH